MIKAYHFHRRAFAGAGDCVVQLAVGLLHVAVCLLGTLVDLLHCGFLLVDQLRNLLVELAELDHVLFDLADCGGSLQGGLASIVGLAGSSTGDLLRVISQIFVVES